MTRSRQLLVVAATFALVAVPGHAAADEATLAFVETGTVELEVPAPDEPEPSPSATSEPVTATVQLVNLAPRSAAITVLVANAKDADGSLVAAIPGLQLEFVSNNEVSPGDRLEVTVAVAPEGSPGESFTAELVATSSQGGIARLPLTVTYQEGDGDGDGPATDSDLHKPLPEEFAIQAMKWLPSPITHPLGIEEPWFGPVEVSVGDDLVPFTVGTLRSASGTNAESTVVTADADDPEGSATFRVDNAVGSGLYTGVLESGNGDDAIQTTMQLSVRDSILWAVVALLAGLWAAGKLERFLLFDRPRRRLSLFLADQQGRAVERQNEYEALRGNLPDVIRPGATIRIFSPRQPSGLLATEAQRALLDFDGAWDREARDGKWGPDGAGSTAYRGYVDVYRTMVDEIGLIGQSASGVAQAVGERDLRSIPAVARVREALTGGVIDTPPALTAKAKAVHDSGAFLAQLLEAFRYAEGLRKHLTKKGIDPKPLDEFTDWLAAANVTDADDLKGLITEMDVAYRKLLREQAEDERSLRADAPELGAIPEEFDQPALEAAPFKSRDDIQRELEDREMLFGRLSTAIVLASGLSALYFANATWGSGGDYLAALLWGTTVGAGLQVARRIGDRIMT